MGGESLTTLGNILLVRRSAAAELTLAMLEIASQRCHCEHSAPGSEPARPIIVTVALRLSERVDDAGGMSISERMDPGQV